MGDMCLCSNMLFICGWGNSLICLESPWGAFGIRCGKPIPVEGPCWDHDTWEFK